VKTRIVIDDVHPRTPTGQYPAKAITGERVPVSADIFKDGHDILGARVRWRPAGGKAWQSAPLTATINDRWEGTLVADHIGMHELVIEAWTDVYATWRHKAHVKLEAGQDVAVELLEGQAFFARRAKEASLKAVKARLTEVAAMLGDDSLDHASRVASATTDEVASLVEEPGKSDHVSTSTPMQLWVDRPRALDSAWYEAFPRSLGGFKGLADHLPYIAGMHFDVLYLPPIHPIGTAYRKGKNNTLDPRPDDVGSPWAIGGREGGHTAIHPDLGTIEDFDELVARAKEHDMEVALDYALQCSPDHPWVTEHPEWFTQRPDGTIAYAENPPKKYQDIYPINFWPAKESDRIALWEACKGILEHWIGHGVKIFRVDNPHTKPIAFWAWVIPAIQAEHPDVLFLAEAFTRPKVMAKLAEVGFTQSYTYFTWRTEKWDLTEYGVEVAMSEKAEFMRPNFWPNTPDILAHPLRNAPMTAFMNRYVLASTLSPSFGIYSGYELGENEPASERNEEYLHSEKYELKWRDYSAAHSIAPWIGHINAIRRRHHAFRELRNLRFHGADNDQVLCYSKRSADQTDTVLVVVNIDPHHAQECTVQLDLDELGIDATRPFEVFDEVTHRSFTWWGPTNYVRLDPDQPAHIFHVRQ